MFGKRVIRLGDPTTHGGKVVSATSNFHMFDKEVARIGDKVICPKKGHGVCTIVEGDPVWTIDGRNVALEGHKTSCGAALISTLPNVGRSYEGMGEASAGAARAAKPPPRETLGGGIKERHDEHFVLHDRLTGKPATGFVYGIATPFGEHHGEIYEDGATVKAYSETPQPVTLRYAMQTEIGLGEE